MRRRRRTANLTSTSYCQYILNIIKKEQNMYRGKGALNSFPCKKIHFVLHKTATNCKHLKSECKKKKAICDHLYTYHHRHKLKNPLQQMICTVLPYRFMCTLHIIYSVHMYIINTDDQLKYCAV
jgi:hypothetical protein